MEICLYRGFVMMLQVRQLVKKILIILIINFILVEFVCVLKNKEIEN